MRRKNKPSFILGVVIVALLFGSIGFGIGYYRYSSEIARQKQERRKEQDMLNALIKSQQESLNQFNNSSEAPVASHEDTLSRETKLVYKTIYTQCQDSTEDTVFPTSDLVGLNEKGLKEYLKKNKPNWEIEHFSKESITIVKRENKLCPDHYLVSVHNGYISIYQYDENGEKKLVEQTDVSVKSLPVVDQEKLQRGIILKTLEDVYQLLEDFSS
ncbi:BofC C-terminal domain-containing protein [Alkaliphilus oremlandii]|uniref:Bypass of forespore C C-terminal domain-containing protein n=1 Tax=Alkaliphilus oremlandii (strain OhILAs) TaxID=350688 RepID=A8MHI7_ALKOO|nr:BofC C-terminal domain-containing protein [Alkaliphilus oremlandii]ABW19269.1 hypothetical protein Clos_1729 [Alkaliphilus oremlandii OhILAs]